MPAPAPPAARAGRDPLVDVLRAGALARVVLWHATAWPVLTWLAAMPVMFFLGGLLIAQSATRRGPAELLRRRLRRLLVPYWAFAVAAWVLMAGTAALKDWPGGAAAWWHPLTWVVPVVDPVGSEWGASLWGPLWYLRTYLWLLVATALLAPATRRGPWRIGVVLAVGFAISEVMAARAGWWPAGLRDALRYAPCWFGGLVVARHGWPSRSLAAGLAAGGAVIAAAAAVQAGDPVLNRVPLAELAAGAALLGVAVLARRPLTALAVGRPGAAVAALCATPLTIYLWHSAGWLVHRELVPASWPAAVDDALRLGVMTAVAALAVLTVGRLEARSRAGTPHRAAAASGRPAGVPVGMRVAAASLVALLVGSVVTDTRALAALAPPSGRFLEAQASRFRLDARAPGAVVVGPPLRAEELADALASWWERSGWDSVAVVLRRGDGSSWAGWHGRGGDDGPFPGMALAPDTTFGWGSMTKTVTAALVMGEVARGRLDLDAPVAAVDPSLPHGRAVTPRQLLGHRSGFADTQLPRDEAIALNATRAPAFAPGSAYAYADVNYHYLARLLERLTGEVYEDLVEAWLDELIGPGRVRVERAAGRGAAGGLVGDLWAAADTFTAVFSGGAVDPAGLDAMTEVDEDSSYGLGLAGACPCWTDDAGAPRATAYGHPGWHSYTVHWPGDDLTVAVLTTAGTGDDFGRFMALTATLAELAAGRPLPG